MTDKKITQLPDADALDGSELVELVQAGTNVQATAQAIADLAAGGAAVPQTLIFTLPSTAGDFSGAEFNAWDNATVVQASNDVHWDDASNSLVFDTAGVYRIGLRGKVGTDAGWPSDDVIVYGMKMGGAVIGAHGRLDTVSGGAGFTPDFVQWTDQDYVVATAAMAVVLGIYADSYDHAGTTARFSAMITVQRVSP